MAYIWGFGEAELILGILGATARYFQGNEDFLQRFGEINALFLGSRDPSGGLNIFDQFCNHTGHSQIIIIERQYDTVSTGA